MRPEGFERACGKFWWDGERTHASKSAGHRVGQRCAAGTAHATTSTTHTHPGRTSRASRSTHAAAHAPQQGGQSWVGAQAAPQAASQASS